MGDGASPAASVTFDVLVVGGGAAGLSAALTARATGATVLLVEKQQRPGGSTAMSIGSFTAPDTRWQRAKGIKDNIEDFLEDMYRFPGVVREQDNPDLRLLLARDAASALAWLDELGVPFVGPFPEPPHRVSRMHNVVPDSRMYIDVLLRHCVAAGVEIWIGSSVEALEQDSGGRVVAAAVLRGGNRSRVVARHGVILATGDFAGNAEMRARYLRPQAAKAIPANPASSGDGHRLGERVGGQLRSMQVTSGPKLRFVPGGSGGFLTALPRWGWLMRCLAAAASRLPQGALRPFVKSLLVVHMQPSQKLFDAGAILVNVNGERFSDERKPALDTAMQPDAKAYLIFDQRIRDRFERQPNYVSTAPGVGYAFMKDYERARPDLFRMARDPGEIAALVGCELAPVQAALASSASSFRPPYFVMGPVISTVTTTEGGLVVNEDCAILDETGVPIAGLFAAGAVAQSGMALSGHGLHIAWAVVSGRRAGRSASR